MKKYLILFLSLLVILSISLGVVVMAVGAGGGDGAEIRQAAMETLTVPSGEAADIFDYDTAQAEVSAHILNHHSGMMASAADDIAQILAEQAKQINAELLVALESGGDAEGVFYLGSIENGVLTSGPAIYAGDYAPIGEAAWAITPILTSSVKQVSYTAQWYGVDAYCWDEDLACAVNSSAVVAVETGWDAAGGLSADTARDFGIAITEAATISSSVSSRDILSTSAWAITMVRPYVLCYVDTYSGIQGVFAYSAQLDAYYYIATPVSGQNVTAVEAALRGWSQENVEKNADAIAPRPPVDWEW